MNDSFLTAALEYARAGFQVFQCEPGGKRPLAATSPHGCRDATNDVEKIRRWWTRYPDANIGLRAGDELVIVDLDVKDNKDGVADLERILDAAGERLPKCPVVITPSGGKHLYFRCPAGLKFKAVSGLKMTDPATGEPVKTGIDIRAGNAYVVAPPSASDGMDAYRWERAISTIGELPELPKCLADVLPRRDEPTVASPVTPGVAAREKTGNLDDRIGRYIDSMDAAVAGRGGHRTTFGALCRLYQGFDLSEPELRWWASVYNERKCEPPWSECEMDHKISDVLKISPTGERGRLLRDLSENRHPEVDLSRLLATTDSAAAPKHADVPMPQPRMDEAFRKAVEIAAIPCLQDVCADAVRIRREQKPMLQSCDPATEPLTVRPGRITILAAQPGCGKTAFAAQWLFEYMLHNPNGRAMLFDVDMYSEEILFREAARRTHIPLSVITGVVPDEQENPEDADREIEAIGMEYSDRFALVCDPDLTMPGIFDMVRKFSPDVVVIDYLQEIHPGDEKMGTDKEAIDRKLKMVRSIARLGCAVILISSITRQRDSRGNSTYESSIGLGSFGGSSKIEYTADEAYLLFRPSETYQQKHSDAAIRNSNVILRFCKSRSKPLHADFGLKFDGRFMEFQVAPAVVLDGLLAGKREANILSSACGIP